jgi:hypothetical protein
MNAILRVDWLPSPDLFVAELVQRVGAGYGRALVPITRALLGAGGDASGLVQFTRDPKTKAAFLLGCAAEEVASLGGRLSGKQDKDYLRAVVEQLKTSARPIRSKRISPDFRRLVALFREEPYRMRVQVVKYMLATHGMTTLSERVAADQVCQLAIECTAMTDGIAGTLIDMIEAAHPVAVRSPSGRRAARSVSMASAYQWDLQPV